VGSHCPGPRAPRGRNAATRTTAAWLSASIPPPPPPLRQPTRTILGRSRQRAVDAAFRRRGPIPRCSCAEGKRSFTSATLAAPDGDDSRGRTFSSATTKPTATKGIGVLGQLGSCARHRSPRRDRTFSYAGYLGGVRARTDPRVTTQATVSRARHVAGRRTHESSSVSHLRSSSRCPDAYQAAAGVLRPRTGSRTGRPEELWSIHEPSRVLATIGTVLGLRRWQRRRLRPDSIQRHLFRRRDCSPCWTCVPRLQTHGFTAGSYEAFVESFASWRPRMIASARSTLRHPGITSCCGMARRRRRARRLRRPHVSARVVGFTQGEDVLRPAFSQSYKRCRAFFGSEDSDVSSTAISPRSMSAVASRRTQAATKSR